MKIRKKKPNRNHRKRFPAEIVLLGGILLLFGGVVSIFRSDGAPAKAGQEVSGTPRLVVDQEFVNLGEIKLGRTVNIGP